MFIRTKLKANNKISVQIVESIRKGNKVSQKIIEHIGLAHVDDSKMLEGLKLLAKDKMEQIKKSQQEQTELFSDIEPMSKLGRKPKKRLEDILPPVQVALSDVREEMRIIEGVDEIAGLAYDELGFNKLLLRGPNQLLKDIVLARLVYPYSKRKLQELLLKQFDKEYNLENIYYMMDALYPKIDRIKQLVQNKTQSLMPNADVVLFDVTTLHFESINDDGLREFGYSKNFRFNTTQVVLALATNEQGLPLGYELFEGNMAEVKTLLKSLDKWNQLFDIKSVCFVADRAMFSKENQMLLDASGYDYVVAAKLRSLTDEMQARILNSKLYRLEEVGDDVMWVGDFTHNHNILSKFKDAQLSFSREEKEQLRDIYKVMLHNNDPLAEEFKNNVLSKLRAKSFSIAEEFKQQLLANRIFIAGSSSNKLIVSYRSKRAKNDQHKREQILKKLQSKTGNVEKVINSGARKYLSVNSVQYHFINSLAQLTLGISDLKPDEAYAFIVYDAQLVKIYMNKPGLKHIIVVTKDIFSKIDGLISTLNLIYHEELSQELGSTNITKQLDKMDKAKPTTLKEIKHILNKHLEDYLIVANTYIDEQKINTDAAWDGIHGIITNIKNKHSQELISKYHNLWRIEEAFRINKYNLKMRPIYHWSPKRIHSHIAICYMVFAVLKLIQYKVKLTQPKFSVIDVIETMLSVQSSIHVHKKTKDKYKLPGSMSHEASALYKAFRVQRNLDASIYQ